MRITDQMLRNTKLLRFRCICHQILLTELQMCCRSQQTENKIHTSKSRLIYSYKIQPDISHCSPVPPTLLHTLLYIFIVWRRAVLNALLIVLRINKNIVNILRWNTTFNKFRMSVGRWIGTSMYIHTIYIINYINI